MAPREHFEFVILRMTFVNYIDPLYPRISLTRKKHSPGASLTQVREWFDRVMSREKMKLPPNANVRYSEWRVISGNSNLFVVDGHRFDKIIILMGEESNHWMFYQSVPLHRRIEGSARLPLTYCGCCLNNQYLNIMDAIKKCLLKPRVR
ncbi:PREDICTED: uncharacterized protein LOC108360761 [Rhagoletis zephyria]|uniref:uncharacterized protein LOC108360761 n=1 Tax=Rhagoletis zephyria TaxID=28612 RepID=UPI00081189C9|nr:PREDICTED: uncharacterized protein LOC108360761 [Rhagoletis zephyria]XP_036330205.1 uncharacterized protein LOC118742323 [Rhagoletis pomonella]